MTTPITSWRLRLIANTAEAQEVVGKAADEIDAVLARQVAGARREGHSWEDIGTALGTSRQAAWARFHAVTGEADSDEPA